VQEKRTAKSALPGNALPCALCRASTHGKAFALRFSPFTVRFARTAEHCIPVVYTAVIHQGLLSLEWTSPMMA
jgi:hypothetical protein